MRGIHRSPVNYPRKGQWRGALVFSSIGAWINGCVNNGQAGDLRRHRAHFDVNVMALFFRITEPYTILTAGERCIAKTFRSCKSFDYGLDFNLAKLDTKTLSHTRTAVSRLLYMYRAKENRRPFSQNCDTIAFPFCCLGHRNSFITYWDRKNRRSFAKTFLNSFRRMKMVFWFKCNIQMLLRIELKTIHHWFR